MHNVKDTRQHIEIAVISQFDTKYARNLVKCYLFKALLQNSKKEPLTNHEIGLMIGCDRHKVGEYLFQMQVFHERQNNPFLAKDFKQRFELVKEACEQHNKRVNIETYATILFRSSQRIKKAYPYTIANFAN